MDVLWATDFFSTEVWTLGGLVTFYVLSFIQLDTREVHIAGVTSHPNEPWMRQVARNLTMEEWGVLKPGQYLMHDRDTKFCAAFKQFLDDAGVKRLPLPAKSPNLNAIAERWIRSVKEEALSKLILFGEQSLWYGLREYVAHYHQERPHQGKGNVMLFLTDRPHTRTDGPIRCRERLGGLLTYYDRGLHERCGHTRFLFTGLQAWAPVYTGSQTPRPNSAVRPRCARGSSPPPPHCVPRHSSRPRACPEYNGL
jgi:putative transposase